MDIFNAKSLLCIGLLLPLTGITFGTALPQNIDPFASQKATFFDEDILRGAARDISQMNPSELRSFAHYVSECSDDGSNDIALHECISAEKGYELEFAQITDGKPVRALDKFMMARHSLMNRPNFMKNKDTDETNAAEDFKYLLKTAKVITTIEAAVRARFDVMKKLKN